MKLTVDFSGLESAVRQMGAEEIDIDWDDVWSDDDLELDKELYAGKEITLDDIDSQQGLLSVKGRQVVLFIPDHGQGIDKAIDDPINGRRFHVAECRTLEEMRVKNRFDRYSVTNNLSGDFPIYGFSRAKRIQVETDASLYVCKNCLKFLNYKNHETTDYHTKADIFQNFSMEEFFATYSSIFKKMPKEYVEGGKKGYSDDWNEVSRKARKAVGYICSECAVDLSEHKRLLHVHHINGVKSDNSASNLAVLCVDCHSKQPDHGHIFVPRKDRVIINKLRNAQSHKMKGNWDSVLKYADTAVHGIVNFAQRKSLPPPDVGYELTSAGKVVAELELAWPQQKLGIYLGDQVKFTGWTLLNLSDALNRFRD